MNNLDLGTKRLNFDVGLVLLWIGQASFISDCTLEISVHLLLWGTKKLCSFIAISVMCIHEVIQMGVVVFDIGLASFLIIFFVIYQKIKKRLVIAKLSMNTKRKKDFCVC